MFLLCIQLILLSTNKKSYVFLIVNKRIHMMINLCILQDMFYTFCGCVLFILAGLSYIQGTSSNDNNTRGYLCLITGVIFCIDGVLVITNQMGD